MKTNLTTIIATLAALACTATLAIAQSPAALTRTPRSPYLGRKLNDHPGIDLKIDEAGERISGTVVFYVQERGEPDSPLRIRQRIRAAAATRVEAKTLSLKCSHAHTRRRGTRSEGQIPRGRCRDG